MLPKKIRKSNNNNKNTDFEKKISADNKTMANYLEGKKSRWIEMEGATCKCRFYAACFQYGTVYDPYRLLQLRVCVRVCVNVMTSEVFGIDFRWISGYRYSCRLVYIIIAMQIYLVYL